MYKSRTRSLVLATSVGLALVVSGCASMSDSDSDDMTTETDMSDMMSAEESFMSLDTNGDGFVSRDEVLEEEGELASNWGSADVNGDGQLSATEYGIYRNQAPDAMN